MSVKKDYNDWKSWCRVCSMENASINIFEKSENSDTIQNIIQNMLSITISQNDEAPTEICSSCHDIFTGLISFSTQSAKVQDMYSELIICNKFDPISDFESLREKYGLKFSPSIFKLSQVEQKQIEIAEPKKANIFVEQITKTKKPQVKRNSKKKTKIIESIYKQNDLENNKSTDLSVGNSNENDFVNKSTPNENIIELESLTVELNQKTEEPARKTISKKLQCDHCVRTFTTKKGLVFHVKSYHPTNENSCKFPCSTCGRAFNNITTLKNHTNMHLPREIRRYYCPHCDEEFKCRGSITPHVVRIHKKLKSFICEECGKGFYFRNLLLRHKVMHSEQREFNCMKCSKKFKSADVLRLHNEAHEDTKFKCSVCDALLNTKALLRKHMIVHSDVPKFKCNFCDKSFKRSTALKGHLLLHIGLKPYKCPFCNLTFTHGSNCRTHQKQSHPIELAQMEERGEKKACTNLPRIETLKAANEAAINSRNTFNK